MKIFITGIAGFLGSHVADTMISLGHEVAGNDNLIGGEIKNVPADATFYQIDCNDFDSIVKVLKDTDIVIHTAATAHEGLSVFSPNFITKNIFQATTSMISASIQNNVKRFVLCSSMARYGNQEGPFCENMNPQPVDPYGIAKVASEQILKTLCNIHGMEWNIAVPHNIIGPRQKYNDPYRNVISIMINRSLKNQPLIIYGNGKQTRCFSYVDDCIQCLEKMALDSNIVNEIINIGPDEEFVSINHVANKIKEKTNLKHEHIYYPDRPTEVKNAVCSSNKARSLLDYKTATSLDIAIDKTIEYIKSNGVKEFDYFVELEIQNEKIPQTWSKKII